jgi:hypothetical protein
MTGQGLRMWRTLVRISRIEGELAVVIVPSWNSDVELRVPMNTLPEEVQQSIRSGHVRVHARVNIGADLAEDLVFSHWEPH